MPRLIWDQIHWGVTPCIYCPNPAEGILDDTDLICLDHLEAVLDRKEAVVIYPQMRQTLPSFFEE